MKVLIAVALFGSLALGLTPTNWQAYRFTPTMFGPPLVTVTSWHWPEAKTAAQKYAIASDIVLSACFVSAVAVLPWIKNERQQRKWCTIIGSVGIVGWGLYLASHCVE